MALVELRLAEKRLCDQKAYSGEYDPRLAGLPQGRYTMVGQRNQLLHGQQMDQ